MTKTSIKTEVWQNVRCFSELRKKIEEKESSDSQTHQEAQIGVQVFRLVRMARRLQS